MDSVFKKTLRSELDFQDVKVKELSVRTGISPRTIEGYLSAFIVLLNDFEIQKSPSTT